MLVDIQQSVLGAAQLLLITAQLARSPPPFCAVRDEEEISRRQLELHAVRTCLLVGTTKPLGIHQMLSWPLHRRKGPQKKQGV